ncbi:MAG TPA: pseudouridine synthase [Fibrobacteraceae bacterium]|nr:pseudouridine synthase [Fibrobacteraceae bacterium]
MRLNQYLALCGAGSRRSVESLIQAGRVSIRGQTVLDLGRRVIDGDQVALDGKALHPPKTYSTVMLNKPAGCVSSRRDPQRRSTVYDYLPPAFRTLRNIGRLDLQSRGLLLFTDDGELAFRLTHPSYEIPRTYQVWTDRPIGPEGRTALLRGVDLGDGETGRARAVKIDAEKTEITLMEGKNREIRRMMQAIGRRVRDLKRISFGPLLLGKLAPGDFRELNEEEIASLNACVDLLE